MSNKATIIKAARAAVEAHRANPKIAIWRIVDTLAEGMNASDDPDDVWAGYVEHLWMHHTLAVELEEVIGVCGAHKGPGVRKARALRSKATGLLRHWSKQGFDAADKEDAERIISNCRDIVDAKSS